MKPVRNNVCEHCPYEGLMYPRKISNWAIYAILLLELLFYFFSYYLLQSMIVSALLLVVSSVHVHGVINRWRRAAVCPSCGQVSELRNQFLGDQNTYIERLWQPRYFFSKWDFWLLIVLPLGLAIKAFLWYKSVTGQDFHHENSYSLLAECVRWSMVLAWPFAFKRILQGMSAIDGYANKVKRFALFSSVYVLLYFPIAFGTMLFAAGWYIQSLPPMLLRVQTQYQAAVTYELYNKMDGFKHVMRSYLEVMDLMHPATDEPLQGRIFLERTIQPNSCLNKGAEMLGEQKGRVYPCILPPEQLFDKGDYVFTPPNTYTITVKAKIWDKHLLIVGYPAFNASPLIR